MKPKSAAALLLSLTMLLFCACAPTGKQQDTPEPTAAVTAAPTDAPTENPTDGPTAAPTAAPTAVPTEEPTPKPTGRPTAPPDAGEMPSFPGAVQLGNLIGGELFPEPAKYLVIPGEGDLKYVYDRFGELVTTFSAVSTENISWSCMSGFYSEHGAPFGFSIERGEFMPYYYKTFDDMAILCTHEFYIDENGKVKLDYFIRDVMDERLERSILMENAPEYLFCPLSDGENAHSERAYKIGSAGGILHVDGVYIIFSASLGWGELGEVIDYGECLMLDENGNRIGELDLAVFGIVRGVFGGKYIVGERLLDEDERYEDPVLGMMPWETNLYTLSGELVMERAEVFPTDTFCVDDETIYGNISTSRFLRDEHGSFFDKELKPIDDPGESLYTDHERYTSCYYPIFFEDREPVCGSGIYAGIKDGEGNWLFRIYNPNFASDSQRSE